jgi:large subunit ribosomal protein L22
LAQRIAPDAQEALATARYIRMSATKARQVVDLIRGQHVDEARRVLAFTSRGATAPVTKALNSAIANAEHNGSLPADELIVTRAWVDEGPTLRRYRPRAFGRATRVNKRTCHISLVVGRVEDSDGTQEAPKKPSRRRRSSGQKETGKSSRRKSTGRKSTGKRSTDKKSTAKKSTAKKKSTSKKSTSKKTSAKKTTARKSTAKKTTAKKSSAKKTTAPRKEEGES